jgi:hypothetical protein
MNNHEYRVEMVITFGSGRKVIIFPYLPSRELSSALSLLPEPPHEKIVDHMNEKCGKCLLKFFRGES